MTERFEQLVWAELDEELSASEAGELATLRAKALGSGGEGIGGTKETALETEIRHLAARLAEVEDVEAPAALKGLILKAIDRNDGRVPEPESGDRVPGGVPRLELPPTTPVRADGGSWLRWRTLAAAGLLIGAVVVYQFTTSSDTTGRKGDLVGTIQPSPGLSTPEGSTTSRDLPDFVELVAGGNRLTASVTLKEGVSTVILAAPGLEVERVDLQEGATGSYESDGDRLTLQLSGAGRAVISLVFADPDQSFSLSTFGIGIEPFEGEFSLHQLSGS